MVKVRETPQRGLTGNACFSAGALANVEPRPELSNGHHARTVGCSVSRVRTEHVLVRGFGTPFTLGAEYDLKTGVVEFFRDKLLPE